MKQEYIKIKEQIRSLKKQNIRKKNIKEKLQISEPTYRYLTALIWMENNETQKIKQKEYRDKFCKKARQDKYFTLKQRIIIFQKKSKQKINFTYLDVLNKFGENTVCYLTGKPINLLDSKTYSFDHFIPLAKGGSSNLDNLRICTPDINRMKTDLLYDDFINLCKLVVSVSAKE